MHALQVRDTEPLSPRVLNRYARGYFAASLGCYLAVFTPAMVAMSFKVRHIVPQDQATATLSMILACGAISALIASPLAGRLSDRTMSRFGRRRPWILGGALVALVSLAVAGWTSSVLVLTIAWITTQAGVNAAFAAANATLADQVPGVQRGRVTGMVGMTSPLAMLGGALIVNVFASDIARFVVPGLLALGLTGFFVRQLNDRPRRERPAGRFSVKDFLGTFVFNPRTNRDFGWMWLTRFCAMFGYYGIAAYVPYYLADEFHLDEASVASTILKANLAAGVAMLVSSPLAGMLSDKFRRRRPFLLVAGLVMASGLTLLAFAPSVTFVVAGQGVIGFGVGMYFAVDLALATQLLPNAADAAKDLGMLNVAAVLPQVVAPAIGTTILAAGDTTSLGGYTLWFLTGTVACVAAATVVWRIRAVK